MKKNWRSVLKKIGLWLGIFTVLVVFFILFSWMNRRNEPDNSNHTTDLPDTTESSPSPENNPVAEASPAPSQDNNPIVEASPAPSQEYNPVAEASPAPSPGNNYTPAPVLLDLPIPTLPTLPLANGPQAAAGDGFSLLLMPDGTLWKWGRVFAPVEGVVGVIPPTIIKQDVVKITAGQLYVLLLTAEGTLYLYVWDRDRTLWSGILPPDENVAGPTRIMDDVVFITASDRGCAVIRSDGSLWIWRGGALGVQAESEPRKILENAVTASVGWGYFHAVTTDGILWEFDRYGNKTNIGDNFTTVHSGNNHHLAINAEGALYAWGLNWYGQLGDGMGGFNSLRRRPARVMENIASASAGQIHSMAVTNCGQLWGWGGNWRNQIGDGERLYEQWEWEDIRVSPVFIMDGVAQVAAGWNHTLAVTADGRVYAWGSNDTGEIGDGFAPMVRMSPIEIPIPPPTSGAPYTRAHVLVALERFMLYAEADADVADMQIVDFIGAELPMLALIYSPRTCPMGYDVLYVLDYRAGRFEVSANQVRGFFSHAYIAFNYYVQAYLVRHINHFWGSMRTNIYMMYQNGEWVTVLETFEVLTSAEQIYYDFGYEVESYFMVNGEPVDESTLRAAVDALRLIPRVF